MLHAVIFADGMSGGVGRQVKSDRDRCARERDAAREELINVRAAARECADKDGDQQSALAELAAEKARLQQAQTQLSSTQEQLAAAQHEVQELQQVVQQVERDLARERFQLSAQQRSDAKLDDSDGASEVQKQRLTDLDSELKLEQRRSQIQLLEADNALLRGRLGQLESREDQEGFGSGSGKADGMTRPAQGATMVGRDTLGDSGSDASQCSSSAREGAVRPPLQRRRLASHKARAPRCS